MMSSHLDSAPVTYMSEVDATELVKVRQRVLAGLNDKQTRPTFTDFFIWMVCQALKVHPQLNAVFQDDVRLYMENYD